MNYDVALCIATIPGREEFLRRALDSVYAQVFRPLVLVIEEDVNREGAAVARNRAIAKARPTTWLAFLDDDDELLPWHFSHLLATAEKTGADLVYPWYEHVRDGAVVRDTVVGRGEPFDPDLLQRHNCIPPEIIVKREFVELAGGFPQPNSSEWPHPDCEDWGLWRKIRDLGAHIVHTPEITWRWHLHNSHTRGLPT